MLNQKYREIFRAAILLGLSVILGHLPNVTAQANNPALSKNVSNTLVKPAPPKFFEIDGRKYVELNMNGVRFRIPRDYAAQLPPHGNFVDGYFWWPEKVSVQSEVTKRRQTLPPGMKASTEESQKYFLEQNSYRIKYWIDAEDLPRRGQKKHALLEQPANFVRIGSIGPNATEYREGVYEQNIKEAQKKGWIAGTYVARIKNDIKSEDGTPIVLSLRSARDLGENATYIGSFVYKGNGAAYLVSRRLIPEWPAIHQEVMRMLDAFTKE